MTRRRLGALALALTAITLSGCSQIEAIAPVGGDRLAEVRYAAIDVLLEADVDVLTAPVCELVDEVEVSCEGETLDGRTITARSPGDAPDDVTVAVGDDTLYDCPILDVLDRASS
jgi:hypothetical protein